MSSLDQQRVSDQLVRLVQVFFALVLGQSLVLFKAVLLSPFTSDHWLAAVAWATVFYTTVASWVDWHVVMARRPYPRGVGTVRRRCTPGHGRRQREATKCHCTGDSDVYDPHEYVLAA